MLPSQDVLIGHTIPQPPNLSEVFLQLCIPFLGRQMELNEFRVTIDSILQQFLEQVECLEKGHCFLDLRLYAQSLIFDLDFWNQLEVKVKLGILKSKIKKADFIYNNQPPDSRLDPTPRSGKFQYVGYESEAKEMHDFNEGLSNRSAGDYQQEGCQLLTSEERSSLIGKLDLDFEVYASEDRRSFRLTLRDSSSSDRMTRRNDSDSESQQFSQYNPFVSVPRLSPGKTKENNTFEDMKDPNEVTNFVGDGKRSLNKAVEMSLVTPSASTDSETDSKESHTDDKIKDALSSLITDTSNHSRVQVGSIKCTYWTEMKLLTSLSRVKGYLTDATTSCHKCSTGTATCHLLVDPNCLLTSEAARIISLCKQCLRCDGCSKILTVDSPDNESDESVYVRLCRKEKALEKVSCGSCRKTNCGLCIVCQKTVGFDVTRPNFSIQFFSLKKNRELQSFDGNTSIELFDEKATVSNNNSFKSNQQLEKSFHSVHKECLKCNNCLETFTEDQICFLQWKETSSNHNEGTCNVLVYDAVCRLKRCGFCHWYPSIRSEYVGETNNQIKVQVCSDAECQQRFHQFKTNYSSQGLPSRGKKASSQLDSVAREISTSISSSLCHVAPSTQTTSKFDSFSYDSKSTTLPSESFRESCDYSLSPSCHLSRGCTDRSYTICPSASIVSLLKTHTSSFRNRVKSITRMPSSQSISAYEPKVYLTTKYFLRDKKDSSF